MVIPPLPPSTPRRFHHHHRRRLRLRYHHCLRHRHRHRNAQIRTTSARDLLGNHRSERGRESAAAVAVAASATMALRRHAATQRHSQWRQQRQQRHFSYENCTDSAKQTARNGESKPETTTATFGKHERGIWWGKGLGRRDNLTM